MSHIPHSSELEPAVLHDDLKEVGLAVPVVAGAAAPAEVPAAAAAGMDYYKSPVVSTSAPAGDSALAQ